MNLRFKTLTPFLVPLLTLIVFFTSVPVFAEGFSLFNIERRRPAFENTPGYLILPIPYKLPGLGQGMMLIGYAGNIMGTSSDVFVIGFNGDAEGYYGVADEFFVIPKLLYFGASKIEVSKYALNSYSSRGMESEKNDFNIMVGDLYSQGVGKMTLTFFERKLEFSLSKTETMGRSTEILTSDGDLIPGTNISNEFRNNQINALVRADLTDDFNDPRKGLKINGLLDRVTADTSATPDYDVYSLDLTAYVPVLEESTVAFQYFQSDAYVSREGNTDLESLKTEKGFSQCGGDASCESAILKDAKNTLNANKNGSAMALGGTDRLRSYPMGRYRAAHTRFYATEFRWNFNTSKSDLNLWLLKDVQEALQVAFFWEQGSVSENSADLGSIVRNSYGTGIRMVAASGNVYRIDFATGDEGSEMAVIFKYPWQNQQGG